MSYKVKTSCVVNIDYSPCHLELKHHV